MSIETKVNDFLGFIDSNIDEINEVKKEKALAKFNELNKKLDLCEKKLERLDSTFNNTRKHLEVYREMLNDTSKWSLKLIKDILGICQYVEYQAGTYNKI